MTKSPEHAALSLTMRKDSGSLCLGPLVSSMCLKAKSDEIMNAFKWRNMISQALHPLRRFSKLVGRCLSLLVKEINILAPLFSLLAMIGVRDRFFVSSQASSTTLPPQQMEMGLDNCFWNLDKDGVLKALNDVAGRPMV